MVTIVVNNGRNLHLFSNLGVSMKKMLIFMSLVLGTGTVLAAYNQPIQLEEVEVLGTQQNSKDKAYNSRTMDDEQINDEYMFQSVPDAMRYNPGVMIQQTGPQQLSPYMRSFTGYRTDLYIDGIRVNNGVWREGPNQYFGTFDPFTTGELETTMGLSTVKYGSDAIGGTTNIRSRSFISDTDTLSGRTVQRFNSSNLAYISRYEGAGKQGDFDFLFGVSPKWYNNVVDGNGYSQPHTHFSEFDGDFKLNYNLNKNHSFAVLFQHYGSDDAWRTHNTTSASPYIDVKKGSYLRRTFDLDRELGYIQYHGKQLDLPIADNIDVSFSVQSFYEPQTRNQISKKWVQDYRGYSDTTIGSFIKLSKYDDFWGLFEYGVETYQDQISSFNNQKLPDGKIKKAQPPVANNSTYGYTSAYFQNTFNLIDHTLDFISGMRYTNVVAGVGETEDKSLKVSRVAPYTNTYNFATGMGRMLWHIDDKDKYNAWVGISQGGRAPTIMDLSSNELARSSELQSPNRNIRPEEYMSYEVGFKTMDKNYDMSLVYYYNDIHDLITRVPTGKKIGNEYQVIAKNDGSGTNQGIELSGSYLFDDYWTAFGYFNWQDGQYTGYRLTDVNSRGTSVPNRLTPINGFLGVRYADVINQWWVQADIQLVGEQTRLSFGDMYDNTRIPSKGSPGYVVPNIRAGYNATKNLSVSASVLNLSNTYYRVHGSGINADGVSGLVQVDLKF
jgi:hemoglobin/transferrin/lactoferrin receptor protein